MSETKRKVALKYVRIWKTGTPDFTEFELIGCIDCDLNDPNDTPPGMSAMNCGEDFAPEGCAGDGNGGIISGPAGNGVPVYWYFNPPPNDPDQTPKRFPNDFTGDELLKKFGLDPVKMRELQYKSAPEFRISPDTGKSEPNPDYQPYVPSFTNIVIDSECKIPGDNGTPAILNTITSDPAIIMPVQSQIQTVKIQVENKSIFTLPLSATQHAIWDFKLDITSEPTDPPLLEDNDSSKDCGMVKGFYFDYSSKNWQITEKKTYSNVLESLPKGSKIRNWENTSTELKDEGIDILFSTITSQSAMLSHSLMKTKSLKARVQRRPRELRAAKKDAAKMIDKSATNNKENPNTELIENYEREVNQLDSTQFNDRLSKSTNKFFGDSDTQPVDAIKLDSGTQLQSFNVPLIGSKQPKFLPGIALVIGRIGLVGIGTWLVSALSEAYQTVKIAALAGIMQAGIIWVVETIFTGGIDLFKELIVEKFVDDAVIHDDKTTGSWDTRRIHYELPRCNKLQFYFREGVRADLTVTYLLHETEQQEYLNGDND